MMIKKVFAVLTFAMLIINVLAIGYLYLFSNYIADELLARLLPLSILSSGCFIAFSRLFKSERKR